MWGNIMSKLGFQGGASGKKKKKKKIYPANVGGKRRGFDPLVGKISWRKVWQLTLVFLPGESHGQ